MKFNVQIVSKNEPDILQYFIKALDTEREKNGIESAIFRAQTIALDCAKKFNMIFSIKENEFIFSDADLILK